MTESAENRPTGSFNVGKQPKEVLTELKVFTFTEPTAIKTLTNHSPTLTEEMPLTEDTNRLDKLIKVTASIFRFVKIKKKRAAAKASELTARRSKRKRQSERNPPTNSRQLTAEALKYLLKTAQRENYNQEIAHLSGQRQSWPPRSKIEPLNPILDNDQTLRVGDRTDSDTCASEHKHTTIVSVRFAFERIDPDRGSLQEKCGGGQSMTQYVRVRYWIPRIRDRARQIVHKCVKFRDMTA